MPRKIDTDIFISKAKNKHGNKFDYSLSIYRSAMTKIIIRCIMHDLVFEQRPDHHLDGNGGCQKCKNEKNKKKGTKTLEQFIIDAIFVHGNKYDYSKSIYTKNRNKINVICKIHGKFNIIAHNHINGAGCPSCGKQDSIQANLITTKEFIERSIIIHNNKYNYSISIYTGCFDKIKIICDIHDIFEQTAASHLKGQGCPKCSHIISKPEIQWLDSLCVPAEYRQSKLKIGNKLIKPDAFDPQTNTIYEFYGDFWHGNPNVYDNNQINNAVHKTFGELYEKTMNREKIIKNAGYNLITIWESEFKNK